MQIKPITVKVESSISKYSKFLSFAVVMLSKRALKTPEGMQYDNLESTFPIFHKKILSKSFAY